MIVLVIIAAIWLIGWLLVREKKEDRLVREAREREQKITAEIRRAAEEKASAERRRREAEAELAREEIRQIRHALYVPTKEIESDFANLFTGEAHALAMRAWGSYIHQSRSLPHKNKFKFAKVERFGNPVTVEDACMAAERVRIAAHTAVINKIMERSKHGC
jgi:hypothetical protein